MLTPSERIRYARHLILPEVGEAGQEALKRGSVLIVGGVFLLHRKDAHTFFTR